MSFRDFHRFANLDTLSKVLGVPISLATEDAMEKKYEELAAKSKLVKTMKNCEIYEYDEKDLEEGKEQPGSSAHTRKTEVNREKESISMAISPFDINAFPGFLDWPREATLRFLSLISVNGVFGELSTEKIYYGFLSEKMAVIKSDEPGLFHYCVAKEDREKIGKVPAVDLKPNYDIRPSPQECEEKMNRFYNMQYIKVKQMKEDNKPGGFEYKKSKQGTSKAPLPGNRRSSRSNPLAPALAEEKKQQK